MAVFPPYCPNLFLSYILVCQVMDARLDSILSKFESSKNNLISPRGSKRLLIALILFLDAIVLGLIFQWGFLNIIDKLLVNKLPNDFVWLMQLLESLSAGFLVIKIFFDDLEPNILRNILMFTSPLFMLFVIGITLDSLLKGLDTRATVTLDLISISTGTLTWASTYLAIAIGLTLTYKVQRYGNFAQSEFFMIGMYLAMVMVWSDYYYPLYDAPKDGVLVYSLLFWTLIGAFVLTGIAGIIIDRVVYRGFRKEKASPQVMMIASLGVALILRALTYLRFGASRNMFEPDADWRVSTLRWKLPTTKFRFNLGDRNLTDGKTYTHFTCEETGLDPTTGEPILTRIISEISRPLFEIYNKNTDCITGATTNYAYFKGIVPLVIFASVILLFLFLNKSRLGRRMRAVADNPELAASSGINVERIQLTSAFLSAGISGLGGAIFAITLRFNPETAFTLLLPSFAVIVLGTIGSISGAIIASLIVGFVRALSSPILIGIGLPLGRSNYTALDGVMPFIFLVAVLMILPEGIGDAYEKWKIDRLRARREKNTKPSKTIYTLLALFPLTGIFGIHHWYNNRFDKTQIVASVTLGAFMYHKIAGFVGKQSFANGSCSDACLNDPNIETNLDLIAGTDGVLQASDSPYFVDNVSDVDLSWFELMQTELWFVDTIMNIDNFIWPLIPIIMSIIAIYQGINLYLDSKISNFISLKISSFSNLLTSLSGSNLEDNQSLITQPLQQINFALTSAKLRWRELNRHHETILKNLIVKIKSFISSEKIPSIKDHIPKSIMPIYGRESPKGSWMAFAILMIILLSFLYWLPIADNPNFSWNYLKIGQVSNSLIVASIFILMAFSLNLHTGITGMTNFGVIFFVAVGAISVGILTAPTEVHGYGWGIFPATIMGMLLAAACGWALAYPTARLRMDYFAIVTISLGEILRVLLAGEPLLRVGTVGSAIGINHYPLPFKQLWFCGRGVDIGPNTNYISADACRNDTTLLGPADKIGEILNLGEPAPYSFLLAMMSIISVILVWRLLETILSSPWGRILKSIREDEDVAQHHGHDVLTHKAASLALGAAIAGLAGALWAWKLTGFEPSFMSPARSTFLVWAAFIIGGAANNKGMIIGALMYALMESVFNVLVAGQGSPDLPLYATADRIDRLFEWLVVNQWDAAQIFLIITLLGFIIRSRNISEIGLSGAFIFIMTFVLFGQRSIDESFSTGIIQANMAYVKLLLIGLVMLLSLKLNPKGLLPEVPFRPDRESREDIQ